MVVPFGIEVESGSLLLGGARLEPFHDRAAATKEMGSLLPAFPFSPQMAIIDVEFGGEPASLSLIFREEKLAEIDLSLGMAKDWVLGPEAEREVSFVHEVLSRDHRISVGDFVAQFQWGAVFSYVGRGGGPHHGLKYGAGALTSVVNEL